VRRSPGSAIAFQLFLPAFDFAGMNQLEKFAVELYLN
jgi:hypothetical protein